MRMKKFVAFFVVFSMLLMLVPQMVQAHMIKNGDYIVLGMYNDEPILWRVVGDVVGDSLEIISDKIISLKAFDGRHANGTEYQTASGSGRWAKSNLRSWLNSTAVSVGFECANRPMNGNVTTNEYDAEPGFLNNFSDKERGFIKKVTNTSIVNAVNAGDVGNKELAYDRIAASSGTDAPSAYTEKSAEYFYLPTVEDIEYIENNVYVFGPEYTKAYPTEEAIEDSFVKYEGLRTDNGWYYWLRDSMYGNDDSLVRCVTPYNSVEYAHAYDGIVGVRPMCTLDTDNIGIVSGNGSIDEPYELSTDPWIALEGNAKNVVADSEVVMSVYKSNISSDMSIQVYLNGEHLLSNPIGVFNVTAESGINTVTAKVVDVGGNIITSASYSFHGLKLQQRGELAVYDTFDNPDDLSKYAVSDEDSEYTTFQYVTENGDGMLYVDSTQGYTASLATHSRKFDANCTSVMVEVDFKFTSYGENETSFMPICIYSNGTRTWWSPLNISVDGIFSITNVEIGKTQIGTIDLNVWYNMKVIVNNETDCLTVVLSDERSPETQRILCSDVKATLPIDYVSYINISLRGTNDSHQSLYLSTLKAGGYEMVDSEQMLGKAYVESDNKTVGVFVTNALDEKLEGELIVAVYDNQMGLKDIIIKDVEIEVGEGKDFEAYFEGGIASTDKIKAFLMNNMSRIVPLSPSVEVRR